MSLQKKDLEIRFIKIVDIAYISIIYFILAYYLAGIVDQCFVKLFGNDFKQRGKYQLIIESLLQVVAIGVISYIVRNIVSLIPFPLNGLYGYDHLLLKELTESSGLFSVFFIFFQYNLQEKLTFLARRDFSQEKKILPQNNILHKRQ